MTVDLGEPRHVVNCGLCACQIGGPYFSAIEAHERKREHYKNRHDVYIAYMQYRNSYRRPGIIPGL